jgi:multiple sugar transport system substrate-binding protein
MHKMNHRLPALLATTVALTAVVGGGTLAASAATPAQRSATSAHSTVVLNYWDMQWGGPKFTNQTKANVAAFNRSHPGIVVKYQQLSWGDYTQKLLSAVQAGSPPDVGGGDAGIPFTMDAQGQTLPIDDLYKQWQRDGTFKDMVPWAYQKWEYRGHDVGITWQFDQRAILYRKDLFRKAGIAVPTTWQQLLAAARKLNNPKAGIIGIAVPGKQGSYDTDQFYMTLVLQAGGGLADPKGNPTFNTPQQLKALEFEKELVKCCAARGTPAWTMADTEKAFDQGKAAMAFGGGWFISDITTNNSSSIGTTAKNARFILQNMGVLPVLIGPGGTKAQHCVSFANPWMIYKQTKHPTEAKIFLKWMMERNNLRKLYESEPGRKWPVYKSLQNDPAYQSNELTATLAKQVVQHGIDYWYPNNEAAVGIATLGTGIADYIVNPVLTGSRSPQDALRDAQTKLGQLFQKQK